MNSIIISVNVIRRLLKEISALGLIFIFPILAALLSSLMFSNNTVITIGAANAHEQDYGLLAFLENEGTYEVKLMTEDEVERKVKDKEINCGIILPDSIDSISGNVVSINKIKLVSIKDGEQVQKLKGIIEGYLAAAISDSELPEISGSELPANTIQDTKQNNQQLVTSIGIISMFIIMFIGTGIQMLLEDKKLKTFMRAFCAPLREYEMVLGHLIANMFLGIIQILIFLAVSVYVFKFDFNTPILNVFFILVIFLGTAIGLGIGIVGFVNDSSKYNMVLSIVAVSMSFLGGCFFPLEYMNDFIKKLSNIIPQKWLLDAFTKLSDGGSIIDIKLEILVVLLFGIVLFTFGVKTLKPAPEDM